MNDFNRASGLQINSNDVNIREQEAWHRQALEDRVDQMRRDDPSFARGAGGGFTFEAPDSMTLSAPGTEAFKQDFAKWEEMRRQATQALETAESTLSRKLQARMWPSLRLCRAMSSSAAPASLA